jgi:SAM-dependent methyltransferase
MKPCSGIDGQLPDSARPAALRRTLTPMSDQDSAATKPRWNSEVAEQWLSRVDGLERSGAQIRELLLERAHLQAGERVLDVGCGSGPSTAAAAKAVHPGGMVTGIDIAAPIISAARQRVGDRDIEWIVGNAETYPQPKGHYDAIISHMGLRFFTNNAKSFANLARACRAGGQLVGVRTGNGRACRCLRHLAAAPPPAPAPAPARRPLRRGRPVLSTPGTTGSLGRLQPGQPTADSA